MIAAFAGAVVTKTRPAVILSSDIYHQSRPDVLLGLITSQKPARSAPTDCIVRDWQIAGLHAPSYFRLYVVTIAQNDVRVIGRLSDFDLIRVFRCVRQGLHEL